VLTKHRGPVKRGWLPVDLSALGATAGTKVTTDGQEVGDLRSCAGRLALAMLRLDVLDKPPTAGEARPAPSLPEWLQLPGTPIFTRLIARSPSQNTAPTYSWHAASHRSPWHRHVQLDHEWTSANCCDSR